jgi:hypothetical protein
MTHAQREAINLDALISPDETPVAALNLKLRPISLGTFMILKRIKSEFLAPRGEEKDIPLFDATGAPKLDENGQPITVRRRGLEDELTATAEFLYIHSAPELEVRRNALKPESFALAVLEFAERIPLEQIPELLSLIEVKLGEVDASNFSVQDKPGEAAKEELGAPKS